MKQFIYIILFSVLLCNLTKVAAQDTGDVNFNYRSAGIQQWFQGWYITMQGDTIKGYIYLSNQIDNQSRFRFSAVNPPDAHPKTLETEHARGYKVKDRIYESLQPDGEKAALFIRRLETGNLNLYALYNIPAKHKEQPLSPGRTVTVNDEKFHEAAYFLRKSGGNIFRMPDSGQFAKEMSILLADDAALSKYISQELNGYRHADIVNIVQQYNAWFNGRQ